MRILRAAWLMPLVALVLTGCTMSTASDKKIDYGKEAVVTKPLDVPPPLSMPAAGGEGVEVPSTGGAAALLPQVTNVSVVRDGSQRWLVAQATPDALWPRLHEFLKSQNLPVKQEDARVGLIETEWAENRAALPDTFMQRMLSKLHDSDMRDMYRVRLERGAQPGTTEIYLTHYGSEKVQVGESFTWQPRASDPELVAEMLSRLMQFLGVTPEQAKAQLAAKQDTTPRARVTGDALVIDEGFARAWRLTGLALDRVGLVVEDLNRDKGLYYVRQTEEFAKREDTRGFFGRLFSSDKPEDKRFQLLVKGDDNTSRLTVQSDKGEPLAPELNKLILDRLQEQLR